MANFTRMRMEKEDDIRRRHNQQRDSSSSLSDNLSETGLNPHQTDVLQLQHTIGNRAVARMLAHRTVSHTAGVRAEGEDDNANAAAGGPDLNAPIEGDVDDRQPSGSAGGSGPEYEEPSAGTRMESDSSVLQSPAIRRQPDAGAPVAPTFPTYSQIVGDSTVQSATDTSWTGTKSDASATQRREHGFWIKYDTASSSFSTTAEEYGPWVGPTQTGAVQLSAKPADSGTTYTVGSFHTHTPTAFRTVGRPVGPSSADNSADTSDNVVGVVYDYIESPSGSGNIPAGHPLNSAAQRYHSGPNKRT